MTDSTTEEHFLSWVKDKYRIVEVMYNSDEISYCIEEKQKFYMPDTAPFWGLPMFDCYFSSLEDAKNELLRRFLKQKVSTRVVWP